VLEFPTIIISARDELDRRVRMRQVIILNPTVAVETAPAAAATNVDVNAKADAGERNPRNLVGPLVDYGSDEEKSSQDSDEEDALVASTLVTSNG
jgi:inorganic pyrophosphatase